jgi:hypothetical protein
MADNPYESPQTEANAINPLSGKVLTENMLLHLRTAAPWLRFVGIVGFVFTGLSVIGFLAAIAGMDFLESIFGGEGAAVTKLLFGVYILPSSSVEFFLSLFTYRFGMRIQSYLRSGDNVDLENAFRNNKNLWTFMGVLCIILLAFTALLIFISILTAVIASSGIH